MSEQEMIARLKASAERLLFRADVGDMGRKPDPTCSLRIAAKDCLEAAVILTTLEGMVMVPRVPTEAMLAAAQEAFPRSASFVFPMLWSAMLAASPTPTPSGAE